MVGSDNGMNPLHFFYRSAYKVCRKLGIVCFKSWDVVYILIEQLHLILIGFRMDSLIWYQRQSPFPSLIERNIGRMGFFLGE